MRARTQSFCAPAHALRALARLRARTRIHTRAREARARTQHAKHAHTRAHAQARARTGARSSNALATSSETSGSGSSPAPSLRPIGRHHIRHSYKRRRIAALSLTQARNTRSRCARLLTVCVCPCACVCVCVCIRVFADVCVRAGVCECLCDKVRVSSCVNLCVSVEEFKSSRARAFACGWERVSVCACFFECPPHLQLDASSSSSSTQACHLEPSHGQQKIHA
jgi:hypothetical protein